MRLEYFEMIDRVVALDREAKRIETRSTVPDSSPVFEGHFPGHPLVPGVLLTETMAQASGYLVLGLMEFTHMPFLMAVDKARFRTFVGPGAERRFGHRGHRGPSSNACRHRRRPIRWSGLPTSKPTGPRTACSRRARHA